MRTIAVAACALSSGCLARSAAFLPPSHLDIGPVATRGTTGTHLEYALSTLAASKRRAASTDIGVGYQADFLPSPDRGAAARGDHPGAEDPGVVVGGPYIDVARRLAGGEHRRVMGGLRGEAFWDERGYAGLGVATRVAWELFGTVDDHGSGGVLYGSFGVGLFAQVSVRAFDTVETAAICGVSLRMPLLFTGR